MWPVQPWTLSVPRRTRAGVEISRDSIDCTRKAFAAPFAGFEPKKAFTKLLIQVEEDEEGEEEEGLEAAEE